MTANRAVRLMGRFFAASFPAGFTLVEDEQKVTQWVWACPSTTGLWMFGSCNQQTIIQIEFFVWLGHQISCYRRGGGGSKALWRLCQSCMIFIFSPRSFYFYSLWEKRRADCNIAWKSRDRTMARDDQSWLCDVHVKVYLVFPLWGWSQKNQTIPDIQYRLAFRWGANVNVGIICSGIWHFLHNHG